MPIPMLYLSIQCLVVDDEATMRVTINNMLTRMGFKNIRMADNGKKALDFIKANNVDLVVCDVNMPEMTGVELFSTVKEDKRYRNICFVFVTAEATRQMVARAAEDGGEAYVIKPFVMATLEDKIKRVLDTKFKPNPVEEHLKNYRQFMEKKDFTRAEEELLQASMLAPDAAKITYNLGQLAFARGDANGAIEYYKKVINANPMFVKAYNSLGEIYESMGDIPSAIKYYESAHAISPANTDRLLALSKLFYKTGETEKADTMMKDAVSDVREDGSTSGHLIGEMYLSKNENEKAVEVLAKANRKNPDDTSIMQSLCEAYRKVGKPAEALELYRTILRITTDNAEVYYKMGKTFMEMGDKSKAIESMKKAWELNPFSQEITADLKALAQQDKIGI
jgi:two-component system chemotaxis response regulator CheY